MRPVGGTPKSTWVNPDTECNEGGTWVKQLSVDLNAVAVADYLGTLVVVTHLV